MPATSEDSARLLIAIEATQRRFEKQMAAVARSGANAATKIENDFKRANDNAAKSTEDGGRRVEKSLGAQRAAVSNLSFQLNDISSTLLSGASPFTVMVQQGGQVAQIFQGSGGLIASAKVLGGAFGAMLSPVSLVSYAIIGLTGVAIQYFSAWLSKGTMTTEEMEKQAESIQKVADRLGDAAPALKSYADEMKRLADERERLAAYDNTKSSVGDQLKSQFDGLTQAQTNAISLVPDANREYGILASKMASGNQEAADFAKVIDALNAALVTNKSKELQDAVDALTMVKDASAEAKNRIQDLSNEQNRLNLNASQAKLLVAALVGELTGIGLQGGKSIENAALSINQKLIPAISAAAGNVMTLMKNFERLQEQVNQTPLGTVPPVLAGGGQFLNEEEARNFDFREAQLREAAGSASFRMIKGYEGFQEKGKWDRNAYRAGYGSDTVTRANGMIEKVTAETSVTIEEATRDLSRRLLEFQDGVQKAIGIETWKSLSEDQQAVLTSIAYNYGTLPERITKAIKTGGGPETVAKAIADLGVDNNGINAGRRKREAQSYLSGTGISTTDAGLSSKRTPTDIFQGNIDQVQKRIDVMTAEYEAQAKLNPLMEDYSKSVEKAKIEQELLSAAQAAGVEISPALRDKIGTLAAAYAQASAASADLKTSQQNVVATAQDVASTGRDMVGGFISDLRNGTSATEALGNALQKLGDRLLDVALDNIFSTKSGGLFGSGGILGSLFSSVPKFADGGWTGAGGKNRAAGVVHKGEVVWSKDDISRAGGVAVVEALRRGVSGYALGGPVAMKTPTVPSGIGRQARSVTQTVRGGDFIHYGDIRDTATLKEVERLMSENNKKLAYAQQNSWR